MPARVFIEETNWSHYISGEIMSKVLKFKTKEYVEPPVIVSKHESIASEEIAQYDFAGEWGRVKQYPPTSSNEYLNRHVRYSHILGTAHYAWWFLAEPEVTLELIEIYKRAVISEQEFLYVRDFPEHLRGYVATYRPSIASLASIHATMYS